MMISSEEFKELVLSDKYDENELYEITDIDENCFNNMSLYYQLHEENNHELTYLFILLSYNSGLLASVNKYLSNKYQEKVEKLINILEKDSIVFLLYDFMNENNEIVLKLLNRISELNYNIEYDFCLRDIEDCLRLIDSSNFNEYSLLIDYIIETFDVNKDFHNIFHREVCDIVFKRLLIKGDIINTKFIYNFDVITLYLFYLRDTEIVKLIMNYTSKISPDKIDLQFIRDCKNDEIGKEEIELLSTLENFDDFVRNNYYFLMKVLDEEAINYVRSI